MLLCEAIAHDTGSPLLQGTLAVQRGQLLMLAGRWREAMRQCDAGVEALQLCRGAAYEKLLGRGLARRAVQELGDMAELERRAREFLQIAISFGDRFNQVAASQYLAYALTARGEVAAARQVVGKGQERWVRKEFHLQHLYSLRQEVLCDLYEGHAAPADARLVEIWPALEKSHLLRVPLVRVDTSNLRGRLLLAMAEASPEERPRLLHLCEKDVRQLESERRQDAVVHACLLRAGCAALEGRWTEAVALLKRAGNAADDAGMDLHAMVARYRIGELVDDDNGRRLLAETRTTMQQCGVQSPARWAALYAPGFASGFNGAGG